MSSEIEVICLDNSEESDDENFNKQTVSVAGMNMMKTDENATQSKERKLQKLEAALEKCGREIKKLDEAEVDLECDENESSYVISYRYKERYMQIRQKIAEIKNIPDDLGRRSDKPFHFNESKFPIVNREIEKFVNRNKTFPDFKDICKVITEANTGEKLFKKGQLHAEAEKIFRKVGLKLKSRRLCDDEDVMSSYLSQGSSSQEEDPAEKDWQLEAKLQNNLKKGQKLIEDLMDDLKEEDENLHDPESDGDESDYVDGDESDFVNNISDEEEAYLDEYDSAGHESDTVMSEIKGKLAVHDKSNGECMGVFENEATFDELLGSDDYGEESEVDVHDKSNSECTSAFEDLATIDELLGSDDGEESEVDECFLLYYNSELNNNVSLDQDAFQKTHRGSVIKKDQKSQESFSKEAFLKIQMEEHDEQSKSTFGGNFPSDVNEVIVIDD